MAGVEERRVIRVVKKEKEEVQPRGALCTKGLTLSLGAPDRSVISNFILETTLAVLDTTENGGDAGEQSNNWHAHLQPIPYVVSGTDPTATATAKGWTYNSG